MSNLMLLVACPFAAACAAWLTTFTQMSAKAKKGFAFVLSLLPLAILLLGYGTWNESSIKFPWISALGIDFYLRIDGLSMVFLLLTAIIIPIAITTIREEKQKSSALFYALILLLQGFLLILFTARDLALFTIAWEAILIPIYFIMLLWGGSQRQNATLQFLIYMIAGSALFVAAVLALYFGTNPSTFNIDQLIASADQIPHANLIFAVFLLAFAVKTPLFPFHAWLPNTYMQAPFAGTILLAALLSKAGIYGIARIGYEIFPEQMIRYSLPLLCLAIAGTLYGALAAWTQDSIKRLIAYSSLSHVNFILAGLFISSEVGFQGAVLQAFNHGITITALFLVTYWLFLRVDETSLGALGGTAKYLPKLCWLTLFFVLSAIALPSTNNFVGELIILFAVFKQHVWLAALLMLNVILSAIYMLRWMQKIYFEEERRVMSAENNDIGLKELLLALPLVALILAIGIYPTPLLKEIQQTSAKFSAAITSPSADYIAGDYHDDFVIKNQEQNAADNRLQDEWQQQRIDDNRREDNRRDVDATLQRNQELRRVEDNQLQRQRQDRRAEDRRADDRRLERSRQK